MDQFIVGTRGSRLARAQTERVLSKLRQFFPGVAFKTKVIRTTGDRLSASSSLAQAAGDVKGLFVKELEEALMAEIIDFAVHSLKDLPTQSPPGLSLAAFPRRADPRDVLVAGEDMNGLEQLPSRARLASGSPRRRLQLTTLAPGCAVLDIRGNVDTRIARVDRGDFEGVVLAAAGLERMELSHRISFYFSLDEMVPAPGQGALAIQARDDDRRVLTILERLDDSTTRQCVLLERSILSNLGGGCQVPIAACATVEGNRTKLRTFLGSPLTEKVLRKSWTCPAGQFEDLAGQAIPELSREGREILEEINAATTS